MGSAGAESGGSIWFRFFKFFLEREPLLSRNTGDPTVADFGARRENDLGGTGYSWTPILVSLFKLLEVGFLPT